MNRIRLFSMRNQHLSSAALHRRSETTAMVVPRRWLGSQEYACRFSARWHEVYDRTTVNRKVPIRYGRRVADFEYRLDSAFPDLGVLQLENGYLVGPHGWVVSREGYLLPDHSWYGAHVNEMEIPRKPCMVIRLNGICLSLASDWASSNYSHFLLDGLCRLDLFIKAGFTLSDVDFFYCAFPDEHSRRLLVRLGIPPEKWVLATKDVAVQADVVLAPSFPGTRRNYPSWVVDFLRRAFTPEPLTPELRLYIPRTTTRRITNQKILLKSLDEHGFEVFDPPQHQEPINYFARAAIIVGGHGAGLANLAFCPWGSTVLELIPSDHIFPFGYTLSESAGLRYGYLIGESTSLRPPFSFGPSPYDFHVDEEEFRHALTETIRLANGTERLNSV